MQNFIPENLENPLKLFDKHYGKRCIATVRCGEEIKKIEGKLVAYNLTLGLMILDVSGRYVVFPNKNAVIMFEL